MVLAFLLFGGGVFDIFETLSELDFVIRVMLFSYLLFWLYTTFIPSRAEVLFGLTGIAAGYLVFAHGISVTVLVLFFIFFVMLGSQLQMLLQFGIMPLLGYQYHGDRFVHTDEINAQQNQQNAQALAHQYSQSAVEEQQTWRQP